MVSKLTKYRRFWGSCIKGDFLGWERAQNAGFWDLNVLTRAAIFNCIKPSFIHSTCMLTLNAYYMPNTAVVLFNSVFENSFHLGEHFKWYCVTDASTSWVNTITQGATVGCPQGLMTRTVALFLQKEGQSPLSEEEPSMERRGMHLSGPSERCNFWMISFSHFCSNLEEDILQKMKWH